MPPYRQAKALETPFFHPSRGAKENISRSVTLDATSANRNFRTYRRPQAALRDIENVREFGAYARSLNEYAAAYSFRRFSALPNASRRVRRRHPPHAGFCLGRGAQSARPRCRFL